MAEIAHVASFSSIHYGYDRVPVTSVQIQPAVCILSVINRRASRSLADFSIRDSSDFSKRLCCRAAKRRLRRGACLIAAPRRRIGAASPSRCDSPFRFRTARMIDHEVKVHPAASPLPREDQLAWKLAALANLPAIDADTASLVASRVIDNSAVALAAINRRPAASARA